MRENKFWKKKEDFEKRGCRMGKTEKDRLGRKMPAVILISAVFLMVLCGGAHWVRANEIDKAEEIKKELEQKKQETEEKITALNKKKNNVAAYIKELDSQVTELDRQISATNMDISDVNREVKKAKKALRKAKKTEKKQYASMKKRIKYMYENGSTDYFTLLLETESFSDFLNRAEYIAKVSSYDSELMDRLKKSRKAISKQERSLEKKAQELGALKEKLDYEQDTVNQLLDDKQVELAKYKNDIGDASSDVADYEKEIGEQEERIEKLLEEERKRIEEEERKKKEEAEKKRLEEERKREEERKKAEEKKKQEQNQGSSGQNTEQNNGKTDNGGQTGSSGDAEESGESQSSSDFRWPLNVAGRITSYFGNRSQPTAGASTYHKGIDIAAPTGTTIYASAGGKVVTASYSSSAGNYVMIYHGDSTYTVYMHCSSLSVSVGQNVDKGQAIAQVGSTGISTGSHLHFGISINGSYVNPLNYVSP